MQGQTESGCRWGSSPSRKANDFWRENKSVAESMVFGQPHSALLLFYLTAPLRPCRLFTHAYGGRALWLQGHRAHLGLLPALSMLVILKTFGCGGSAMMIQLLYLSNARTAGLPDFALSSPTTSSLSPLLSYSLSLSCRW